MRLFVTATASASNDEAFIARSVDSVFTTPHPRICPALRYAAFEVLPAYRAAEVDLWAMMVPSRYRRACRDLNKGSVVQKTDMPTCGS